MTKSEQVCALSGYPSAGAIYPSRVDYYALRCKPLIYFMKGIRRQNESRAVPPLDMGEKIPSVGALCDLDAITPIPPSTMLTKGTHPLEALRPRWH